MCANDWMKWNVIQSERIARNEFLHTILVSRFSGWLRSNDGEWFLLKTVMKSMLSIVNIGLDMAIRHDIKSETDQLIGFIYSRKIHILTSLPFMLIEHVCSIQWIHDRQLLSATLQWMHQYGPITYYSYYSLGLLQNNALSAITYHVSNSSIIIFFFAHSKLLLFCLLLSFMRDE